MSQSDTIRWRSAIAEGFAVLVGILLAFGIDAAWDVRNQREEVDAYLEAIRTELESNREQIEFDIRRSEAVIDESYVFLETVAGYGATPSYEETLAMVAGVSPRVPVALAKGALTDLLSSGGLSRIDAISLRRALSEYERVLVDDELNRSGVRDVFSRLQDYHNTHDATSAFPWEEFVEVPETDAGFPLQVEAFVANRTYASLLVNRMLAYSSMRNSRRRVLERIDAVLALMDGAV